MATQPGIGDRWVVITGSLGTAMTFRGPFASRRAAEDFRSDWEIQGGEVVHLARLEPPDDAEPDDPSSPA
jgi:hypothetical protein